MDLTGLVTTCSLSSLPVYDESNSLLTEQDFCSSEAHSVPGKVKVITETDHLAPLSDLLALLKLLHSFTQEGKKA